MNPLKLLPLALLAACSGGDSEPDATFVTADSSVLVVDATTPSDGGATSDGMSTQQDASSPGSDGGIVFSDGGVISSDGGLIFSDGGVVGLDSGIAPLNDGGLPIAPQCVAACTELSVCFGDGQAGFCETACTEDLQDCSQGQIAEFDVCNAEPTGLQCADLITCLSAITCLESA